MKKSDLQEIGSLIKENLEPIKKTLSEHSDKLDSLTLDMIEIQRKTDAIRDIHALVRDTREAVNDHEQRINILENAA